MEEKKEKQVSRVHEMQGDKKWEGFVIVWAEFWVDFYDREDFITQARNMQIIRMNLFQYMCPVIDIRLESHSINIAAITISTRFGASQHCSRSQGFDSS